MIDLINYPNYHITKEGDIYSTKGKSLRKLKPAINQHGYLCVVFSYGKNQKCCRIHRLVAEAFIDNPLNLPEVNHKDGNKLNNYYLNLEWSTTSQNTKHAYDNGLCSSKKEKRVKLSYEQVQEIRDKYENQNISTLKLGKEYNVHSSYITKLVNNKFRKYK